MTPLAIRCARCQQPIEPGQEREVGEEQGTGASLVYVHRDLCRAPFVRQHQ